MKYLVKIIYFLLILGLISNCSQNNAPAIPIFLSGPTSGENNTDLTFSSSTTDPDGDDISYQFVNAINNKHIASALAS